MANWQAPFEPEAALGEPDNILWAHAVHCAHYPKAAAPTYASRWPRQPEAHP
jgi:hypothetical protein